MFSTRGLFSSLPCPERAQCRRINCLYSHDPNAKQSTLPHIPVSAPVAGPSTTVQPKKAPSPAKPLISQTTSSVVPTKRQSALAAKSYVTPSTQTTQVEPPRKFQRIDGAASKVPTVPAAQSTVLRSYSYMSAPYWSCSSCIRLEFQLWGLMPHYRKLPYRFARYVRSTTVVSKLCSYFSGYDQDIIRKVLCAVFGHSNLQSNISQWACSCPGAGGVWEVK